MGDRGAGDAKMHFAGARIAHHLHDFDRSGPAHDRVIDEDDAFAVHDRAIGAVLQPNPELADALGRLDEGAPDVVIADDAKLVRERGFLGVANRGGNAGIRHRDDHVGIGRRLAGKLRTQRLAYVIHVAPAHDGIGTGEIDVFENAGPRGHGGERLVRLDPALVENDDLAVFHITHEFGADNVEGTRLGSEYRTAVEVPDYERADAERVACANELLVG